MAGFLDLFMKFMFIGFIVLSLFSFIILFQSENTVSNPIIENELINRTFGNLETQLEDAGTQTEAARFLFVSDIPLVAFASLILKSIVSAGTTFNSLIAGVFSILLILPVEVLGLSEVITSVLVAVLGIAIIFGLWSVYKLGTG